MAHTHAVAPRFKLTVRYEGSHLRGEIRGRERSVYMYAQPCEDEKAVPDAGAYSVNHAEA
jgi:hypothetical protein